MTDEFAHRVLFLVTTILLPFAVFSNKGIVVLVALCSLTVIAARPRLPRANMWAVILPSLLLAWGMASMGWAINFDAATSVFRMVLVFAMALVLHSAIATLDGVLREDLLRYCLCGCVATMALLTLLAVNPGGLVPYGDKYWENKIKPASTLLAICVWPAVVYVWRRRSLGWAMALVALTAAALWPGQAKTASLALAAGLTVFLAASVCRRWVAMILAVMVGVATLLAPVLALQPVKYPDSISGLPSSGQHRLEIWDFVAERIAERPMLGWGYNSSRAIPGGKETTNSGELLPLHPHNAPLQIWLELGLPGAILATLMLVLPILAAGRWQRDASAAALAAFTAAWVVGSLSYGIWQQWWLCSLIFAMFLCRAMPLPTYQAKKIGA